MTISPTTTWCLNPQCALQLPEPTNECPRCQMTLTGPSATRLREVYQTITEHQVEATALVRDLLPSPVRHVSAAFNPAAPGPEFGDSTRQSRVTGQQLLLGFGALLLLCAASVFLLIVWMVVGVAIQAVIMVALTATAVAGSRLATKRGLGAAAETGAVLAVGLLFLDLAAAYSLGLAGLDRLPPAVYWAGACLLGGVLLAGWTRLVPTACSYPWAAVVAFTAVPWFEFLSFPNPSEVVVVAGLAVVGVVNTLTGFAALAFLHAAGTIEGTDKGTGKADVRLHGRGRLRPAWWAFFGAVIATASYLLTGLGTAYDFDTDPRDRYLAVALLGLGVIVLAALTARNTRPTHRPGLIAATLILGALTVGAPLADAPWWALVVLALTIAGGTMSYDLHPDRTRDLQRLTGMSWARATRVAAAWTQPGLFVAVTLCVLADRGTISGFFTYASAPHPFSTTMIWWASITGGAWVLTSAVAAWRTASLGYLIAAHTGTYLTLAVSLYYAPATIWVALMGIAFLTHTAVATFTRHRSGGASGTFAWDLDATSVLFGSLCAATAITAATFTTPPVLATTLILAGASVIIYAGTPHRLPAAYLGSLTISAGTWVLSWDAHVDAIEAYTLPLAGLLAAIGFVHYTRDLHTPTMLTMGPALSVALGPTLLVGWSGDDARMVVAILAAVALLFVGVTRAWRAPITTGGLALGFVALTQGGPMLAYVPGWVTLGFAGATLLAAGVAWESAVHAGKRSNAWYATLT